MDLLTIPQMKFARRALAHSAQSPFQTRLDGAVFARIAVGIATAMGVAAEPWSPWRAQGAGVRSPTSSAEEDHPSTAPTSAEGLSPPPERSSRPGKARVARKPGAVRRRDPRSAHLGTVRYQG